MKREDRVSQEFRERNGASHRSCVIAFPSATPAASALPLTILLFLVIALPARAEEKTRLTCQPHSFQVVPGEPIRLDLTVLADSAAAIQVRIPSEPLLLLRAIEKLPVHRTDEGQIIHRRVVLWQALEPGTIDMKTISVETRGRKLLFPKISIKISDPGP